jgi:HK97 family phage portal protein
VYTVNGLEVVIPLADVVHFRDGIDPAQERLGRSRLASLLREVVSDNQATAYEAALLKNFGVPGVVIAPGDAMGTFDQTQQESLRAQWQARTGGEARGKPLVFSSPVSIQQLSLSPEALALDNLRTVSEDRISAALRLPPQVTGLTSGGKRQTFANYEQARRAAYQDCILPIGRRFARTLQAQLLPDLGNPDRERVAWDYSTIAALAEDRESLTRRAAVGYRAGILQRGEARESLGYASGPEDAVYAQAGQGQGQGQGQQPAAESGGTP